MINYASKLKSLQCVIALAVFVSTGLSHSTQVAKGTVRKAFHERYFPWAGVDPDSYVYWPTTAPDLQPLRLVKAGKRAEAFAYCLNRLDTTRGDDRFFYSIQAASIGYGLKKSHYVVRKLLPQYRLEKRQAIANGKNVAQANPNLVLALAFAVTLSDHSTSDIQNDFLAREWQDIRDSEPRYLLEALSDARGHDFLSRPQISVKAIISFLSSFQKPSAADQWRQLIRDNERNPQILLAMSTLVSVTVYDVDESGKQKLLSKGDPAASLRFAEAALEIDSDNVRALYKVASKMAYQRPERAIALFTKCLALGSGPAIEIESAKARLAELKSAKL